MNKPVLPVKGEPLEAFKVRLLAVGDDEYLLFVKDKSSVSDYVRLSYGYADSTHQKNRKIHLLNDYIVFPKSENGAFLGRYYKEEFKNKKLWVVFQTVQRQKGGRGLALERFAAISPPQSKWTKSIGCYTDFELKKLSQAEYNDLQFQKLLP
jgi:hypothetical protein